MKKKRKTIHKGIDRPHLLSRAFLRNKFSNPPMALYIYVSYLELERELSEPEDDPFYYIDPEDLSITPQSLSKATGYSATEVVECLKELVAFQIIVMSPKEKNDDS